MNDFGSESLKSLKTVKIRLEAISFSSDKSNNPFASIRNSRKNGPNFHAVVGRALTRIESEPNGLSDGVEIGDRLCCMANLPFFSNGTVPNEIEISPYESCKVPSNVSSQSADCVACLSPSIRTYTSLHTLARIRKDESILIASPNDLNFTCLAIQICRNLNLRCFALVADDLASNVFREKTGSEDFFKLDTLDSDAMNRFCDTVTGNLGFDCVLDFKNTDSDYSGAHPITFSKLIRLLAVFGRIITDRQGEPISAVDATVLHFKSSSVHYRFDDVWLLSPLHYGRYKHMVTDIVDQLKNGNLRPGIGLEADPATLDEVSAKHDERVGCTVIKF